MKKIIKSITKNESKGFHPAVGFYYDVVFTDNSTKEVSDDELLEQFYNGKKLRIQTLVGKEFEIEG